MSPTVSASCGSCAHALFRRKTLDLSHIADTKLSRCLGTLDLTALGVGSTLGVGIYIVTGQVAKELAGPAVIVSFLVAAVASFFAGLCYAEFGARVPKTGSAYVYSYVTVGEVWAFIIGWNLLLEYVIGTASVARAWTAYLDSLLNETITRFWEEHLPIDVPGLSPYPDFLALGVTLLLTAILCIGVKESSVLNNIFTVLNLLVVTFIAISGIINGDLSNWNIPQDELPGGNMSTSAGVGGFFPYGVSGMLAGSATCFYAFIGFDCIATSGEEVREPQRAIPVAILLCLAVCAVAYMSVSGALTLMVPYYLLSSEAPLPDAFAYVGWQAATYAITVGALCGLSTSMLGSMFPMPRIIYAMSSDGLLFRFLSHINERSKTPLVATVTSGILAGTMAMFFELAALVEMMSIGTLLAYTMVAASVLILRYDLPLGDSSGSIQQSDSAEVPASSPSSSSSKSAGVVAALLNTARLQEPNASSARIVRVAVILLAVMIFFLCVLCVEAFGDVTSTITWWSGLLLANLLLLISFILMVIARQPPSTQQLKFKVPFVPILPAVSMFVNIFLMLKLSLLTWARFSVWMLIGFFIYFGYGIWHSSERASNQQKYESIEPSSSESTDSITNPSKTAASEAPIQLRETTSLVNGKHS